MLDDYLTLFVSSPSVWREWIEIYSLRSPSIIWIGLPPCGGSGLKYHDFLWWQDVDNVSLRVEGVD